MLFAVLAASPVMVHAEQLVARSEYTVQTVRGADPYEQGIWFTTGDTPPVVAALGFIDLGDPGGSDGDGLQEAHTVNLWRDSDASLVASVEIPAGTAAMLEDGYRWANIAEGSITLEANTGYTVSSDTTGMTDSWFDAEAVTLNPYYVDESADFGSSWGGAGTYPSAGWFSGSCYGLVNLSSTGGGVFNPQPENGAAVLPGVIDLTWEHVEGGLSDVYWNAGAIDVNEATFDPSHPSVVQIGDDVDDNIISVTVTVEKNYYWRVDHDGRTGPVWHFTTKNSAPEAEAGLKQAKWLPDGGGSVTFTMDASATDDGLPSPGLTYSWSAVSGVTYDPGGSTSTAQNPDVIISSAGVYTLTLNVSDSELTGSDTVELHVRENDDSGMVAHWTCDQAFSEDAIVEDNGVDPGNPSRTTHHAARYDSADPQTPYMGDPGNTLITSGGQVGDMVTITEGGLLVPMDSAGSDGWSDPNYVNPYTETWADFRDEVTLSAWIKVNTTAGGFDHDWEDIIAKGDTGYRMQRTGAGDSITMTVQGVTPQSAEGDTSVNDGEWHHVVGTYDGAHVCLYVDGLEDTRVETNGAQINVDRHYLSIACNLQRPDFAFAGDMDEIRIYKYGLPHRSDAPEASGGYPRSVVSLYREDDGPTNCGGVYLAGDANEDCYVGFEDVVVMAQGWLDCNSIARERCD